MGSDAHLGETPLELLMACHARIRRYVGGLRTIAELDDPGDPRIPVAAAQIAHYLRVALPLHERDEEDSLAPRIGAGVPDVVRMIDEHRVNHVLVPPVVALCERLAAGERIASADVAAAHASVWPHVEAHLALEEAHVFPLVAGIPDPDAFVRELRARRAGPG